MPGGVAGAQSSMIAPYADRDRFYPKQGFAARKSSPGSACLEGKPT
jgi:hypothetical protein